MQAVRWPVAPRPIPMRPMARRPPNPSRPIIQGCKLRVLANATNTGASTLNVDSLGAKAIRKYAAGSEAAIAAGDLVANAPRIWFITAAPIQGQARSSCLTPCLRQPIWPMWLRTRRHSGGDLDLNGE